MNKTEQFRSVVRQLNEKYFFGLPWGVQLACGPIQLDAVALEMQPTVCLWANSEYTFSVFL
jgi:hypothetical protein